MQKKNQLDHNDSAKIEECVMKDREKYIMSKDVKKQHKKVKKCIITEGKLWECIITACQTLSYKCVWIIN